MFNRTSNDEILMHLIAFGLLLRDVRHHTLNLRDRRVRAARVGADEGEEERQVREEEHPVSEYEVLGARVTPGWRQAILRGLLDLHL